MGCCTVTYEEEVENEIENYLKNVNCPDETKKRLLKDIKDDLIRRASTVNRYYYPYRIEDVQKTVNFYKNFITIKLKGFVEFYDSKKNEENKDKKKENEKNKMKQKIERQRKIIKGQKHKQKMKVPIYKMPQNQLATLVQKNNPLLLNQ